MSNRQTSRRRPGQGKDKQSAPSEGGVWPPAIDAKTFWLLALIPLLVFGGMNGRGLARPFEGLHAWAQADSAWFCRNHVRYGLGYTEGVMTMAVGDPPPENPKRYYDHPQYSGLLAGVFMWIVGPTLWAVRLGFLVSDCAALLLFMGLLRKFAGAWPALLAGLVFAMLPISAYFGLGAWLFLAALIAFHFYLVIAGDLPGSQPRWWHYAALAALLFACVQMSWSGVFWAAGIGFHYLGTCIFRRRWPKWHLVAVLALAPLASAAMVFTIMLKGFNWDFQRIVDLYTWRAAEGEMAGRGGFRWSAWFERAGVFALGNFTWPVLLAAGGFLVYLLCDHAYQLYRKLTGGKAGRVFQPFPLAMLLLLPGLLQMFVLKGALWPHQFWERPLGPFIAAAAGLGVVAVGRLLGQVGRSLAAAGMAAVILLFAWQSVRGANAYYRIVWNPPQKIAMWQELNQLTPSDKKLATFDRELDSLVVTQSAAKGAVYRGEPAWYIDRVIVDANTPQQVDALAASGEAPVYLLPAPRSLGYAKYIRMTEDGKADERPALEVFHKHNAIAIHLARNYPVINIYRGLANERDEEGKAIITFGMRPYVIFDLTKPGRPTHPRLFDPPSR